MEMFTKKQLNEMAKDRVKWAKEVNAEKLITTKRQKFFWDKWTHDFARRSFVTNSKDYSKDEMIQAIRSLDTLRARAIA